MTRRPLITFCIATYNRGAVVVDCLEKVLGNGLGRDQFEVIVVDNASTDGTAELIEGRKLEGVEVIRLAKNCGPVAKNVAMRKARGEFVVLLDDDAYPHPGAVAQMVRHFREDADLGAAVFDVTLPDGSKEGSAYPDVFIGAGTGLRKSALEKVGLLPGHFFMQAEEYDLSFRLLNAGWSVQRFWDLPLTHLKTPGARIGQRTTRLDVRNNLYLLAKYVPEPLCHRLAADWLARYFLMAQQRDAAHAGQAGHGTHKQAFIQGSAQGLQSWSEQREGGRHLLSEETIERVFKFRQIRERLGRAVRRLGARRVVFADFGKNMLAYFEAARALQLDVPAIADDTLGGAEGEREYRGIRLITWSEAQESRYSGTADLVVVSNMSPVHAPKRAAALRRTLGVPVVDLFSRQEELVQGMPAPMSSGALT